MLDVRHSSGMQVFQEVFSFNLYTKHPLPVQIFFKLQFWFLLLLLLFFMAAGSMWKEGESHNKSVLEEGDEIL